jgi:cytochrome c peroxidase
MRAAHLPRCLAGLAVAFALFATGASAAEKVKLPNDSLTTGIPGKGPLSTEEVKAWLAKPENNETLEIVLPTGLDLGASQIAGLKENPLTRAKIELGRQLYFDTRLCGDNTVSCAHCHHPDEGFGRNTQFGVGVEGKMGNRNSPVSYNRILSSIQFWDGRAGSLEEQAKGPIANPIEMNNTHEACVSTIGAIPAYKVQFETVFGKEGVTIDNIARAIASFERVLVTDASPYDYAEIVSKFSKLEAEDLEDIKKDQPEVYQGYVIAKAQAEKKPMSESAVRGQKLFFGERVNCAACHVGANLTDEKYHNLGVGMDVKEPDLGRYNVTKKDEDWGAFKTPTIRNVEFSAPYMHDGSQATLLEVVEHYNKGGTPNKNLSNKVKKLNLTEQEKLDLVAFMKACTGKFPKVEHGRLPADQ